ncbi:NAD(P)H-dependent oxidoreductase [uncultured Corynebacterium sp.]|uniref:NAD(P)H-dependent oxidoreductase n=1 Tax=uncultured Corynebacterium sp. TaxID=159447 RepID=UPI0025F9ECFD|nr:NAD(P)H-dependent oxidoreductase [uncultured Corynebacterium sp.]
MHSPSTILWVSAHPSPHSLNASLRDHAIASLRRRGHRVLESDLYGMGWNPVLDGRGFVDDPDDFDPSRDVREAHADGRLPADVVAEQRKILEADGLVLQFPLWWYGTPAILKGWFDRVLHAGFAFGTDPDTGKRLRFEQGPFRGKRALVVTTLGDRPGAIGPRGKSGELHQMLFGLLHGTLAYTGFDVLPPMAIPSADRITPESFGDVRDDLDRRLTAFFTDSPIAYRPQFQGEYTDEWTLVDSVRPGETGLDIHIS